jgi:hypothetical protein
MAESGVGHDIRVLENVPNRDHIIPRMFLAILSPRQNKHLCALYKLTRVPCDANVLIFLYDFLNTSCAIASSFYHINVYFVL